MIRPIARCWGDDDPLLAAYHDKEWGRPVHNDRLLFEHLALDGFQAGLSWRTILHKRAAFREDFADFDPDIVAEYGSRELRRLLKNQAIVRNRQKIEATINNARRVLEVQQEFGSFDRYIWAFTGRKTLRGKAVRNWRQLPTTSPESDALSEDLKRRGFKFVGSTICYAFMQAVGMVDDHMIGCFRFKSR